MRWPRKSWDVAELTQKRKTVVLCGGEGNNKRKEDCPSKVHQHQKRKRSGKLYIKRNQAVFLNERKEKYSISILEQTKNNAVSCAVYSCLARILSVRASSEWNGLDITNFISRFVIFFLSILWRALRTTSTSLLSLPLLLSPPLLNLLRVSHMCAICVCACDVFDCHIYIYIPGFHSC